MSAPAVRGWISKKIPTWIRIELRRVGEEVHYVAGDLASVEDGKPCLFNSSPLGGSLVGLCSEATLKRWSAREASADEVAKMMPLVARVLP